MAPGRWPLVAGAGATHASTVESGVEGRAPDPPVGPRTRVHRLNGRPATLETRRYGNFGRPATRAAHPRPHEDPPLWAEHQPGRRVGHDLLRDEVRTWRAARTRSAGRSRTNVSAQQSGGSGSMPRWAQRMSIQCGEAIGTRCSPSPRPASGPDDDECRPVARGGRRAVAQGGALRRRECSGRIATAEGGVHPLHHA